MKITQGIISKAQKIVVYGPEGIGKSTFASHFPEALFSDTEGSTTHLDVKRFEKPTSWSMLMAQVEYVKQNKPCSTYVIDTADWAEKLAKEHVINSAASPKIKSIEDFGYGKGYTMLAEEFGRLLNRLQELVDVGVNVVVLAHAQVKKFEQPQEIGSYDRWELKLEKKTAPLVKEWADAVLFATYEIQVINVDNQGASKGKNKAQGGSRVMYSSHNPAWDAKNRWGLADKLDFNFTEIAQHVPDMIKKERVNISISEKELEIKNEIVKENNPPIVKAEEIQKTDSGTQAFPEGKLGDLMKTSNVSVDELLNYIINVKKHFPEGTPFENLPDNYTNGALISAWDTVVAEIKHVYNENPKTY